MRSQRNGDQPSVGQKFGEKILLGCRLFWQHPAMPEKREIIGLSHLRGLPGKHTPPPYNGAASTARDVASGWWNLLERLGRTLRPWDGVARPWGHVSRRLGGAARPSAGVSRSSDREARSLGRMSRPSGRAARPSTGVSQASGRAVQSSGSVHFQQKRLPLTHETHHLGLRAPLG